MAVHELKTWPEYFEAIRTGAKRFEIRRDDRGFAVGDELILRLFDPIEQRAQLIHMRRTVTYLLAGGQFGIEPGFVALGLSDPE